jgi:hypothetical protein
MKSIALILNSIVLIAALVLVINSGVQLKQIIIVFIFFFAFILNIVFLFVLIKNDRFIFHSKAKLVLKNLAIVLSILLLILGLFSIINSHSPLLKQIAKAILFFPSLITTITALTIKTKNTRLDLYFKKIFNARNI